MEPLLRFNVGHAAYALPLDLVGELAETPSSTPVPGSPEAIRGLADIRGRVVTLVDLARVFGVPPAPPDQNTIAVVLSRPFAHLALLVEGEVEILHPLPAPNASGGLEADGREADEWEKPLSGADACTLIDIEELIVLCTRQLRDRYRLPG